MTNNQDATDTPELNMYEALRRPVKTLKQAVKSLPETEDIEVLHQLRVSTRKIRSLLSLIRAEDRIPIDDKLLSQLKKFARLSNRTRDMDVFLNYIRESENDELYGIFLSKRDTLYDEFIANLKDIYKPVKKGVRKLLFLLEFSNASIATDTIAGRIRENFELMEAEYSDALDGSNIDTAHLHDFRKACKKLRYQGEASGDEKTTGLINTCKEIQEILGNLHDYTVWIAELRGLSRQEVGQHGDIQPLMTELEEKRQGVIETFTGFIRNKFNPAERAKIKSGLG